MRDISLMFGGTTALDCVDFELVAGEIHALAGENGAGKSSLIKMLAGIYAPERGSIELQGVPTVLDSTAAASAAGIAVIHQELNLVDSLSAVDNLFLGKEIRGRWGLPNRLAMQRKAHDMLGQLGFPADIHLPVGGLRMGERQLVEIAKALLANASVLIMDEPTSALSASEAEVLYGLCRKLRDRGLGVILITHRLQEVFMLSDRITVLRDGRKIGTWATCEIASQKHELTFEFVGYRLEILETLSQLAKAYLNSESTMVQDIESTSSNKAIYVILLAGGDKSSQNQDIRKAKALARDLQEM